MVVFVSGFRGGLPGGVHFSVEVVAI
jgi:hypothetical protein